MGRCVRFVAVMLFLAACQVTPAATWYVDGSVSSSGDGKSWETAFQTIQEGIDAASHGDTVIVAEGTYIENIHFGKNVILRSTDPLDPDVVANTIIDGNRAGSVVTFWGNEGAACVLSGFTIRNGLEEEIGFGGGIYGAGTRAGIVHNRIIENQANGDGAGLYDCDGVVAKNVIARNSSVAGGGLASCDGLIVDNIIVGNSGSGGGLLHCMGTIRRNMILHNRGGFGAGAFNCSGTIEENIVAGNQVDGAEDPGGGLCECRGTIRNNLIVGNWATWRGGGVAFGEGLLLNNTIARNRAGESGGGIANYDGEIANCVIWENIAASDSQIHDSGMPTFSCIEDWTGGGEGNITEFPMFIGWPLDTGQWTDAPIFDERTWQTTLVDTGASWLVNDLKGLLMNPDTSQPLQFVIASNTETTINVWGDILDLADAGENYEIYDYRLGPESPCVDAGDNLIDVGRFDLDGNYRRIATKGKPGWNGAIDYVVTDESGGITILWKGLIDMGACECQVLGPVPETFTVYTRDNMDSGDWTAVFSGNVSQWTDEEAGARQRFYRVEME